MTRTISREDLESGLRAGQITVVDALPESYYEQAHLPGAVNLLAADVGARAAEVLPDTAARIVTYCANEACANSAQLARALEGLGYTDVLTYPGGIQDWTEAGLPTHTGAPART